MTKLNFWKCDICSKIYGPNEKWNETNEPIDLYIPAPSQHLPDLKVKFEDTCGECRDKIIDFINSIVPNNE